MENDKHNRVDAWVVDNFRPFAKTWMEMVRNAIVVGVFIFLARKSDSASLLLLAYFTAVVFGCYCLSYILLSIPISRSDSKYRVLRWAFNLGSFAFATLVLWMWGDAISKVLFKLADLQIR